MRSRLILLFVLVMGAVLVACGSNGTETQATGDTVEVTVEVTRIVEVEVPAAGGETGAAMPAGDGVTVAAVRDAGVLKCGGNANLVGFGFLDPATNEYSGFDVDLCKAIAAAVFGEGGADQVEVRGTTGTDRFPVLQAGEVDVLIRNTTWTISRDTSLGFDFGPTTFYDGQGMMVRTESGIETLEDLEGGAVCVQAGTTTEKNLADVFRGLDVSIETLTYPDNPTTTAAYQDGVCDGFTTDKSGLIATRSTFDDPEAHVILDATMSKEPLGPLWRHGDNNWGDIVTWSTYCTMQAEELGITSENVDDMLGSDDPVVQGLLGQGDDLGQALNLSADFCYQIIKQVGNFGEIYDRNLGSQTNINLARGVNDLWTNGGLIYAPPFR